MQELASSDWESLILQVHSAGLDASRWTAFMADLIRIGGHAAVTLIAHDPSTRNSLGLLSYNYDEPYRHSYSQYYHAVNPWIPLLARAEVGKAYLSQDLLSTSELMKTEFYHDWIMPQDDIASGVGINLHSAPSRMLRLSCNIRQKDAERVQPRMLFLMERLAPHLVHAVRVTRQLAGIPVGEQYATALELVPSAVMLLDSQGRICFANQAALALSQAGTVLRLARQGSPLFADKAFNAVLIAKLSRMSSGAPHEMVGSFPIRTTDPDTVFTATLTPFAPLGAPRGEAEFVVEGRPVAMLCLSSTANSPCRRLALFARSYNLTPAEQDLARALFAGSSLQMVADKRQVSIHTARNQLKSIFSKTGVSRQSQLMALMAKHLPAPDAVN